MSQTVILELYLECYYNKWTGQIRDFFYNVGYVKGMGHAFQ